MKNYGLIYDVCSKPEGIDLEFIMHLFNEQNVLFYDSSKGERPSTTKINLELEDIEVEFLDVSKQENLKRLTGYKKKIK